jgi:disease resistance protein RPS2
MKKSFPLVLLQDLVSLEEIRVEEREKMEEIIATRDQESSSYSISEFTNPPK